MTNRERAVQIGGLSVALVDAITRALDDATAEADKRAREAEADAAAMQAAMEKPFCQYLGHGDEPTALEAAFAVFRNRNAGASLLAELEAARELLSASLDVIGAWEGSICIVDPRCGNCRACRFAAAAEKHRAARGAR